MFALNTVLNRYLCRQFFGPFFLAVAGFTLMATVDILFYLSDISVLTKLPFRVIIQLLLYKLPAVMMFFYPMATLFAVMLTLIHMIKNFEIMVLLTSGVRRASIFGPFLVMSLVVSLGAFLMNDRVVSVSN